MEKGRLTFRSIKNYFYYPLSDVMHWMVDLRKHWKGVGNSILKPKGGQPHEVKLRNIYLNAANKNTITFPCASLLCFTVRFIYKHPRTLDLVGSNFLACIEAMGFGGAGFLTTASGTSGLFRTSLSSFISSKVSSE